MEHILNCTLNDLITESDVEQKFIVPILLSKPPLGLNYLASDFRTKPDIRQIKIDKGGSAKLYYPDYVIINYGLPLFIIEAKRKGEDLRDAYREACLYCLEINTQFPHQVNPCKRILVTDGETSIAGYFDSDEPVVEIKFEQINSVDPKFLEFSNFLSRTAVFKDGEQILAKIRGNTRFTRPLSLIGGKTVQNEELRENSFGATLSLEFRYLFNPESQDERKSVVVNAYAIEPRKYLYMVETANY